MGFFPDPHDRDSSVPEEGGEPEWAAPPIDVIPIVVPILLVLGRSESAAVLLTGVTAYPTGLSVSVSARIRYRHPDGDLGLDLILPSPRHSDPSWHAERLKWGFEYVDCRRATSVDPPPFDPSVPGPGRDWKPSHPMLQFNEASANGARAVDVRCWLWPLPPPGRLRVACEWPAQGIDHTVHDLDAQLFLDAAARARPLW
jgi:hypothetical protein